MTLLLLLFSLRLGSASAQFLQDNVPGIPGEDYPFLSTIPFTSFSCFDRAHGYYADTESRCQVFHICHDQRQSSFLCPNGTLFNQRIFVCDWWFKVDCSQAPNFYFLNEHVFQFGSNKEDFMMSFSKTGAVPSNEINNNALLPFSRNEEYLPRERESRPTNPFTNPGSFPSSDTITSPLLQQLQEQFLKQQQELEQLKKQQEQVQQQFEQFQKPKKQQSQEPQQQKTQQFQPLQQKFQQLQEPQQQEFHQQVQQQIMMQQQRPQQVQQQLMQQQQKAQQEAMQQQQKAQQEAMQQQQLIQQQQRLQQQEQQQAMQQQQLMQQQQKAQQEAMQQQQLIQQQQRLQQQEQQQAMQQQQRLQQQEQQQAKQQQQQRQQQSAQQPSEQSSYLPYSFSSYTYRRPSNSYGPPPPSAFVPTTQVFNEVTTTTARPTTTRTTTMPPTTTRFTEKLATVRFRETDAREREFELLRSSDQLTPDLSMPYDGWLLSSQDPNQIINILRSSKVFVLHRLNDTEELSNLAKTSSSSQDTLRISNLSSADFLRPLAAAAEPTSPRPSSRNNFAKQIIELKPAPPPTQRPPTTPAPTLATTPVHHQTVSHYHIRIPPHTPPSSTKFVAPPALQPELRNTLQTLLVPNQQSSSYYAATNPFFGTLSKPSTFQSPGASFDSSPRYDAQTYYQSFPNPVATLPPVPLPLEPLPPTMVFRNLTILKAAGQPAVTTTTPTTTTTTTTVRPVPTVATGSTSSEVEVLNVQTVFNTQSSPDLQQSRTQFSINLGSGFRSPHYIVLTPHEAPFKASQPFASNNVQWSPRTTTAAPSSTVRSTRDSLHRDLYPMPGKYPRHIESYQFRSRYYD